jgi:hypothetical protein
MCLKGQAKRNAEITDLLLFIYRFLSHKKSSLTFPTFQCFVSNPFLCDFLGLPDRNLVSFMYPKYIVIL